VAWNVIISFHVEHDVAAAARWYEDRRAGLGHEFLDEVIRVWHELAVNPLLAARKHPTKNLRWRYPERFPYRIIYEVDEASRAVLVLRVVHAARSDAAWCGRV
jgi:plasmid stabilization system protein ParE